MDIKHQTKNILCIDLKSFFASAECIDRGLDPFTTPLVVANLKQGNGAITLAVTPYLKAQGVKSRSRLYEIPKNIKYQIVPPRMSLYTKKSSEVVNVYLNYVSEEDLHIYSIDEAFLDVTNYLNLYKKTDYELALEILSEIKKQTGLYATCGIGPNILLAKVAMDVEAKNNNDFIAKWTYSDIETKLWKITPLSRVWGIGKRIEAKLNALNIYTIKELANYNKQRLRVKFGIIGEELWKHANGIDNNKLSDWKEQPKDKSYSHSQVLFKDYDNSNIKLIIEEMVETMTARLRANKKQTGGIGLGIGYSMNVGGGFYHVTKLPTTTSSSHEILDVCNNIFDNYYTHFPIRKVTIALFHLEEKTATQLNLFQNFEETLKEEHINETIDTIKEKFGKNSLMKASSLLSDSTAIERNNKKGGHTL